jgi:sugar lactone lactonase YvrE
VGTGLTVTATNIALSGTGASNYTLSSNSATTTANITAVQLTVTATSDTSTYGLTLPPLAYSITGFLPGDTQGTATTGAPSEAYVVTGTPTPNTYGISIGLGNLAAANYTFTFVPGVLQITQAGSTTAITALNSSVYANQTTTLTATVSVTGYGVAPTGSVTFYNGSTQLGTAVALSPIDGLDSTATLSLPGSQLAPGANSITAVYSGDPNYVTSTSAANTVTLSSSQTSFGSVNVGTAAPLQTLTYSFVNATTLSAVNILTAGAQNLDYMDGGSSTCTAGTTYSAGQSCVVTVAFTPSAPGLRSGGVTLFAQGSTLPLQTWYLSGVGQSSAVTIDPGTQTTLAPAGVQAYGSAIDGAGNLYVVDQINSQVIELTAASSYQTSNTIVSSASALLKNPTAVALDGAGNLYIADTGNSRVVVVPNEQGTLNVTDLSQVSISGLGSPKGIAVDGSGNLYVADATNGVVVEVPAGGGTPITVASGLTGPQGLALDAASNVYVTSNSQVAEYPVGGGAAIPMGSGYITPVGVAVDASGTVYVADSGNSQIVVVAPGGASRAALAVTGVTNPQGVSVDASANLYITASGSVYEVNRTQAAALAFANTNVGSTSTPQTVTVSDVGNQPLNVSTLALTTNFTQVTSGSTDCASGTQLLSAGQCLIAAESTPTVAGPLTGTLTLSDNAFNNAASTQTVQLSGDGLAPQTILFAQPPAQPISAAPFPVSASSTSGLPVTLTSTTPAVCAASGISPATVTLLETGDCTIRASQAGNSYYARAGSVFQSFSVAGLTQTITFPNPGTQTYGAAPFTMSASSTSGLPVAIASATPAVCTASGTSSVTVTLLEGGLCQIKATVPANGYYAVASVLQSFTVQSEAQTITFPAIPATTLLTGSVTAGPTSSLGLPVTLTSTTPLVCTVLGTPGSTYTVNLIAVGTCGLSATQAGTSGSSAPAISSASIGHTFAVTLTPQTITFAIPAQTYGAVPFSVSASSTSGLPVTLTSTTPAVCTASGTSPATITLVESGLCTINATVPANSYYATASVTQSFSVAGESQTITFPNPGTQTYGAAPFTMSASSTSGLPVAIESATPAVCTASGTSSVTVTLLEGGLCQIKATVPANSSYASALVLQSFTVQSEAQTITFPAIPATTLLTGSVTAGPTSSLGLPVTLTSTTPLVCTVLGTPGSTYTVNLIAVGTCGLSATQAGTSGSSAPAISSASIGHTFAVTLTPQAITFAIPAQTYGAVPFSVSASSTSGLPVTLTSTTPAVCTASGTSPATITLVESGLCTINATVPANSYYATASVTQSFSVAGESQTITFPNPGTQTYGAAPFTMSASSTSGLPVAIASATPAVCTASGTSSVTVTLLEGGLCQIKATVPANSSYASASVLQSFTVQSEAQTITFPTISATRLLTGSITASPTSSLGLPVTLTSTTPLVCTASGTPGSTYTVNLLAVGTCGLSATQAGTRGSTAPAISSASIGRTFAVTP